MIALLLLSTALGLFHFESDTFLIPAADSALDDAKEGGRNQGCIYTAKG